MLHHKWRPKIYFAFVFFASCLDIVTSLHAAYSTLPSFKRKILLYH